MDRAKGILDDEQIKSTLVSRNITIFNKRTSVRLEPEMWASLHDIASRERCTIHDICSLISMRKQSGTSLTAAIRVFVMLYFKAAATEQGHNKAGHGSFELMKRRARISEEYMTFFSGPSRFQNQHTPIWSAQKPDENRENSVRESL